MFDVGSAIGHIILDSADWNKGMAGITKSMFGAQVLFKGFEKIVGAVADTLKKGVEQFLESEKVSAQLSQTLKSTGYAAGLTKREIIDMAAGLQQTTRFEDDAIISGQNLLLTFTKIGKDVFPQATEIMLDMSQALGQDLKSSAIQVGKALQDPVLGVTALRRVGVNFSEDQQRVIKSLVETGRQAEAQAMILKELQVEFGGSAKAARDTFGGALKNLENNTGDFYESIGQMVAIVGRDFVESMSEGMKSINDFISSEEGFKVISKIIADIGAGFELAKSIFQTFGETIQKSLKKPVEDITKAFNNLFGNVKDDTLGFKILAATVKGLGLGFAVASSLVGGFVTNVINLVNLIKESVGILVDFGKALADPLNTDKWAALDAQVKKTQGAFTNFTQGMADSVKSVIDTTVKEFSTLNTDIKVNAEEFQKTWTDAHIKITNKLIENKAKETAALDANNKQQTVDNSEELSRQLEAEENAAKKKKELQGDWAKIAYNLEEQTTAGKKQHILDQQNAFIAGGIDRVEVEKWAAGEIKKIDDEAAKNRVAKFQESFTQITSFVSDFTGQITDLFGMYYDGQLTREDNDYEKKKANIEKNIKDEKEKTKALEALEAEHDKKESEIKKKQWKINQAVAVGQAIMDTTTAVMKTFATYGFTPWGIGAAAAMGILGAIKVGMIASQPMPAFELGGIAMPGPAIVGEKGPEVINIGSTSRIIPADETASILNRGNGVNIYNTFGDVNSDIDIIRYMELSGSSYRSAMRSGAR